MYYYFVAAPTRTYWVVGVAGVAQGCQREIEVGPAAGRIQRREMAGPLFVLSDWLAEYCLLRMDWYWAQQQYPIVAQTYWAVIDRDKQP